MSHVVAVLAVVTALVTNLHVRDLFHVGAVAVGLGVAVMAHCALTRDPGLHTRSWIVALVVGIGACVWADLPARPTRAIPENPKHEPPTREVERILVRRPLRVGLGPSALAVAGNELWVSTSAGLVHVNPRRTPVTVDAIGLSPAPSDLAVTPRRLVAVHSGRASIYDIATGRRVGRSIHFSEASEDVAAGFGSAWLANVTHSKVERLDLRTRALTHIAVPGTPTAILLTGGSVWVAVREGWVVRIDPENSTVTARIRTEDGPAALTYGFGRVWVAHPRSRHLTRIDPETFQVVGTSIAVAPDVRALAVLAGSVWAVSAATDQVQRIDPSKGRVIGHVKVPAEPTDLVAFARSLFVTSANSGTISAIDVERTAG